jgi:hypothetical protein
VNRYVTALFPSTLVSVALLLAACGSSSNAPAPQPASQTTPALVAKPDVIITVDGTQHACVVALYSEPHGSSIPCTDLIPFLRDELRVPNGAVYDLRTTPGVDNAEVLKVHASLKDAGYAFVGGHS